MLINFFLSMFSTDNNHLPFSDRQFLITQEIVSKKIKHVIGLATFSILLVCSSSMLNANEHESNNKMQVTKSFTNPQKHASKKAKFTYEYDLPDGEYTYIIKLTEPAIAMHDAASIALREKIKQQRQIRRSNTNAFSTNKVNKRNEETLSAQITRITNQQALFLQDANLKLQGVRALARYKYALNGVALKLTQQQAKALASLPNVESITRDQIRRVDTDRGPSLIGSPAVWSGSASPSIQQTQGEGIIIGIIDSGVNTDHPSFAEVSGDGFIHSNPLGSGVFLGDCARGFPQLCNNKLIGVYSYTDITNDYTDTNVFPPNLPANGEDYGGHGSHVASTAAGNILFDVDEVFPTFGELRDSGTPTGFTFEQLSGVAPRANIISYQTCYGGTSDADDTYADCVTSAILKAIDDAIEDAVDVINFSISGGGDPWSDATEQAFLAARNAGIFVAVSAGNSGAQASTSEKLSPWYTSVAASEHGRENVFLKQLTNFSGGASSLTPISGQSNSGSITAAIVYAGDFTNPNDPTGDPAQCLEPFPAGTFTGQIVVCDRGSIARVAKAENVASGGAGGYVLANVDGGETFLANDQYVVPGIHINAENGNRLKTWLNTGLNHRATITQGLTTSIIREERVDVLADFSSRGPNTMISTLAPTMSAPGVDIYAAYADEQLGHDGHEPAASDYDYLSGTSMSSPHVAGAAALLKAAHPDWNPDEIRSALSLTAKSTVLKEDGESPADFFDMGAGRIQVDQAIQTGLIMSESGTNYLFADPDIGGDPRTLNLPSITDSECAVTCTWKRTFKATRNATWTFEQTIITDSLSISASPASFTLLENQTQEVQFTIQNDNAISEQYAFGLAKFTSPGLPDVQLPVSVLVSIGDIPSLVEFEGRRDIDTHLVQDISAISIDNFVLTSFMPVKATSILGNLRQDSVRSSYTDDFTDGVNLTRVTIPENAIRLAATIESTDAIDLDLYVIFDADNNGELELTEEVARSQSFDSDEEISIRFPQSGDYYIVVHNFSGVGNNDFEMRYAVVTDQVAIDELQAEAPSTIVSDEEFDIRINYILPGSSPGDDYYAAIALGRFEGDSSLGNIGVNIDRGHNDVFIDATPTRLSAGESSDFSVVVEGNSTSELRQYEVVVPVPVGTQIDSFTTSNQASFENNEITWRVNKFAGESQETRLNVQFTTLDAVPPGPINIQAQSLIENQSASRLESTDINSNIQIEGSPTINFNGEQTIQLNVTETTSTVIPLQTNDPNDDTVTLVFNQRSGPVASIEESLGVYTLTAPRVDEDTLLEFDVTATDSNNNSTNASFSVTVLNNAEPVINSISAPSNANGGDNVTISVNASDPENATLQITINGGAIQGNSTSIRVPSSGSSVSYTVAVSDGISEVSQTITISLTQTAPPSSGGGGGGGGTIWYGLVILPLALWRRIQRRRIQR